MSFIKNNTLKKYLPYFLALFLLVLSIVWRNNDFKKPYEELHEWLSAHVSYTVNCWLDEGISPSKGNLVFNKLSSYKNEGDFELPVKDTKGRAYYVSYPPLPFYIPWAVAKILGLSQVSELFIRVLNTLIFTGILFLLIKLTKEFVATNTIDIAAYTLSSGLLIFSPAVMWFYTSVYFSDTLVILFYVATIYYWKKTIIKQTTLNYILYALFLFLGCYTDWIMFLLALVLPINTYLIKQSVKNNLLLITLFIPLFSIGLFIFQESSIAGFEVFKTGIMQRFTARTGFNTPNAEYGKIFFSIDSWKELIGNYAETLKEWLYLLLALLIFYIIKKRTIKKFPVDGYLLSALFFPGLLHTLLLFNFSVIHEFSVVKFLPLLFVLSFVLINQLINSFDKKYLALIFFGVIIGLTTYAYFTLHSYNQLKQIDTKYGVSNMGISIREKNQQHLPVVLKGEKCAELVYYLNQVPFYISKDEDIDMLIKSHQLTKYFLITCNGFTPVSDSLVTIK